MSAPRRSGTVPASHLYAGGDQTQLLLARALAADLPERQRLREEAVTRNVDIAYAIARRYTGRGEPFEDLAQVACVGLVKAADRYDPDRGHTFLQYAVPTIVGEVKRYFRDHAWTVRPPRRIQELHIRAVAAVAELSQEHGRSPRISELAERLEVGDHDIVDALTSDGSYTPDSLDDPGREGGYALVDTLGEVDHALDQVEATGTVRALCRDLPARERYLLYRRFFSEWTQTEIAAELGISQMHVSRLLRQTLEMMRERSADTETRAGTG